MPVCPILQLTPTGWILIKFYIWRVFRKSVDKLVVLLKLDKNNEYFTCRPIYIFGYTLLIFLNEKYFTQKF
jgi:hypothetical protein